MKSKRCVIITSTKSDVWIKYVDAKIYLLHNMHRYSIQTMGYLISLDLELAKPYGASWVWTKTTKNIYTLALHYQSIKPFCYGKSPLCNDFLFILLRLSQNTGNHKAERVHIYFYTITSYANQFWSNDMLPLKVLFPVFPAKIARQALHVVSRHKPSWQKLRSSVRSSAPHIQIPEFYVTRDNKSVIDRNYKHAFHLKSSFLKTT